MTVTEEIRSQQTSEETVNPLQHRQQGHTLDTGGSPKQATPEFNRYLYENLTTNVQSQIEFWIRRADHETANSQVAQALRLKAEGLGYALRLLNAFEPEFRELVECANRAVTE